MNNITDIKAQSYCTSSSFKYKEQSWGLCQCISHFFLFYSEIYINSNKLSQIRHTGINIQGHQVTPCSGCLATTPSPT